MAVIVGPVRGAYAGAAGGWAADANLVYEPLARHLVARSPISLDGLVVLDAGAGTGVAGSILSAAGARVIESDIEATMLDHDRRHRPAAAVADVAALPFRDGAFDAVVAAFVLNHVDVPVTALGELARVSRPGAVVLASTFAAARAAAKNAFDSVARRHGWRAPSWHEAVNERATAIGTPAALSAAAGAAGFVAVTITETDVDVGLDDPEQIVRYRLAMPQYATWLDGLDGRARSRIIADAVTELGGLGEPFRPAVLELVARVG